VPEVQDLARLHVHHKLAGHGRAGLVRDPAAQVPDIQVDGVTEQQYLE
jgi:hypothetical protein